MEVEVEELCTQTVAMTPIMSAATGFCSRGFSLKMLPVSWPPEEIKESEKKINRGQWMSVIVGRGLHLPPLFSDAPSHLYERSCPSVGPSVGPSHVIFEGEKDAY